MVVEKLKKIFLYLSVLFIVTGVSFVTAYNWDKMNNVVKMLIPISLITLGVCGWYIFYKKELYRKLSLLTASFFVGTLFATYGQIYQTGADSYTLFLNWGLMILIFSCVEIFYPLWFLNIIVFATSGILYMRLFVRTEIVMVSGGIIFFFIIFLYLIGIKKLKLPYSNWFFYSLLILGLGLITAPVVYIAASSNKDIIYMMVKDYDIVLTYLILLVSTYIIGKKIIKQQGIILACITSITAVLISYVVGEIKWYTTGDTIGKIMLVIMILILSVTIIVKKFIKSNGVRIIVNFFKLLLIVFILILIGFIGSFFHMGEKQITLLGGLLFLGLSCFIPHFLKFKESKSEIVTAIIGTLLILFFLDISNVPTIVIVAVGYCIYALFWYFRHSPPLDYLLVPAFMSGLLYISDRYSRWIYRDSYYYLSIISLLFILATLLYKKRDVKIIERAVTGVVICLMILRVTYGILEPYKGNFSYILSGIQLIISLKILYAILEKKNIISYTLIGIIISIMHFINLGMLGITLGIMIVLLYLYKNSNFMLWTGALFLMSNVSFYYYSLNITLLEKSYMLLKTGAIFMMLFLILNWKSKVEAGNNEKETSIF